MKTDKDPAAWLRAVNTTGAGDCFVAGLISALLDGASFRAGCEAGMRSTEDKICL